MINLLEKKIESIDDVYKYANEIQDLRNMINIINEDEEYCDKWLREHGYEKKLA